MILNFVKEYVHPAGVPYDALDKKKRARLLQLFMNKLGDDIKISLLLKSLLLHLPLAL